MVMTREERQQVRSNACNRYEELTPMQQRILDSLINAVASKPDYPVVTSIRAWLKRDVGDR